MNKFRFDRSKFEYGGANESRLMRTDRLSERYGRDEWGQDVLNNSFTYTGGSEEAKERRFLAAMREKMLFEGRKKIMSCDEEQYNREQEER